MKKQHYTAEIPVSNPYNFAAFEDLIANIQSGYNEEKRLKNAAFEFMINKGIYVDFHEWLHNPARQHQSENIRGRFRMGTAATTGSQNFSGDKCPRARNNAPACISEGRHPIAHPRLRIV